MNKIPENFERLGFQLDYLVSFWLVVALFAVSAAFYVVWRKVKAKLKALEEANPHSYYRSDKGDGWAFTSLVFGGFGAVVLLVLVIFAVPFNTKYYYNYSVEGTVTSVSNVITESNGELNSNPVIEIDTLDQAVLVEDARAVSLEGKDVKLRCAIDWNYQAADKYNCQIAEIK